MLPDRVSNPGPLTYESGALPIALHGPADKVFSKIAPVTLTLDLQCLNTHLSHILSYLYEIISKSVHKKALEP